MSDEIRNALLEEFPEPPERDVVLMQLKGDLIDTLSGLSAVEPGPVAVTGDVAPEEPCAEEPCAEAAVADEPVSDEVASDEVAAEAPAEAPAPTEDRAETLQMLVEDLNAQLAAEGEEPAEKSKRGQTMQFFIDDLDLSKRDDV